MNTRLKNMMQTVCIVLILMLFPGTAHLQEQKVNAVPPASVAQQAEAPVPATGSSVTVPVPVSPAPAPQAEAAAAAPAPAAEEPPPYAIKKGDTLWDISNTFLKDPFLWPFIWKANPGIANPDLIFPGNKLVIPSLAPIERALKAEPAPTEPVAEKQAPVQKAAASVEAPAAAGPKPVQPTVSATGEEMPARKSGIFLPEEQVYPVLDKYAMLSMGYVSDEETGDAITGSPEKGQSIFGYDDIVYVSMHDAANIKIGDKYLIYTHINNVKHPKTGKNFGKLIKGLGILQITAKDQAANVLTARITLSFDSVEIGNMLTPYQEPVPVYQSSKQKAKDISGYILEVTDRRSINAQTDVVYLDKGNADGVEPGDRFSVYEDPAKRGFPRKLIGEVQVLIVKEHTATAVVQKSTEAMGKGNAVDFKK